MENRLKERLTGAAILVALIVALVPELFRGQSGTPSGSAATATTGSPGGSSGDGPPVRTYTIDLSNNPGTAPLQSATEPEPTRTQASTPPAAVVSPPASPPPTPAPPVASPSAAPHTIAPSPPAAHVARAQPTANTSPIPVAPKATSGGNWSVQLGLFSKRENAERMVSDAKAKGFNAAVSNADAKGQFHVHVTGLTDRSAAQAIAQKLKGEGLPAAVVAP
jgi:DedD protein